MATSWSRFYFVYDIALVVTMIIEAVFQTYGEVCKDSGSLEEYEREMM